MFLVYICIFKSGRFKHKNISHELHQLSLIFLELNSIPRILHGFKINSWWEIKSKYPDKKRQ